MKTIKLNKFGGIIPKISPKLLPDNGAQTAQNCTISSGRIEPIHNPSRGVAASGKKKIYLWRKQDDTTEWLTWTSDADVVSGVIADDDKSRIFYTGDGAPKVKGWVSGSATTKDLKQTAPTAPIITSVNPLFTAATAAGITCTQYVYLLKNGAVVSNLGQSLGTPLSYSYDGGNLILTFGKYYGTLATGLTDGSFVIGNSIYKLSIPALSPNTAFTLPTSGSIAATSPQFSSDKKIILGTDNVKFAEMQIVDCEDEDISRSFTLTSSETEIAYLAGGSVKFVINMNYMLGAETQYRYYIQSLVNDWDMESPPSVNSTLVEVKAGHTVSLEGLCGDATNTSRIYRSAAGSVETNFFFVADVADATYTDKLNDSELAESLEIYENPDDDLEGLVALPQGFLAGFKGKEIHFSYPNLPNCWSTEFRLTIDYDIVGLGVSGNDLVILTNGFPYIASGSHPSEMSLARLPAQQSCVSKKSICSLGNMVVFASPDGLIGIQGGNVKNLTESIMDKEYWTTFNLEYIMCGVYDNRIYMWHLGDTPDIGVIFDFTENIITTTNVYASYDVFSDTVDDKLYFLGNAGYIWEWDDSTEPYMLIKWKSKEFQMPSPLNFVATRIIADTYADGTVAPDIPIKFSLFSKTVEVLADLEIADDTAVKLPDIFPSKQWSFQIESYSAIDEISLSTAMSAVRGDGG